MISQLRVLTDQKELWGLAARCLPRRTCGGSPRAPQALAGYQGNERRLSAGWAALGAAGRRVPGVRIADKVLDGVTCIRLDATVTPACSDKELAEPNFKGLAIIPCAGTATSPASRWPG